MAIEESRPNFELLKTVADSFTSAAAAFLTDSSLLHTPASGISLLDVKNELLLSYLQNLSFVTLAQLRRNSLDQKELKIYDEAVTKLVELRVYIERGVRPLEGRLKYQIDKVLRVADDADRIAAQRQGSKSDKTPKQRGTSGGDPDKSGHDSAEDDEEDDDDDTEATTQHTIPSNVEELSHRARPGDLVKQLQKQNPNSSIKTRNSSNTSTNPNAVYKPPRITPTSMPTASNNTDKPDRKRRSNLLNEYIDDELSSAPRAEPSIGSNNTITNRGRTTLSQRDLDRERERTEYEERNYMRLPTQSKAEKRKAKARGEGENRDIFGGEDWTGLGGLGDRISKSVAGRSGREGLNVLQRREKRKRDGAGHTVDRPRGDGLNGIGGEFEKRRRIMEGRAEKKSRRKTGR